MNTMRNRIAALAASLLLAGGVAGVRAAALPEQPQAAQPKYTRAEYDAYQAAAAEKNPQQKIKLLDDFVAKYPSSDLLSYVYDEYLKVDSQLKNWPKVIEYFDKKLALPNLDKGLRLQALYGRAQTYELAVKSSDPNIAEEATKARDAALEGLKVLDTIEKPANASDEQFAAGKKQLAVQFYTIAGLASAHLKDYKAAADNYSKSVHSTEQPVIDYRMGLAELQENPPDTAAGFWSVARAVDQKVPDADKVTKFLHDKIFDYQTPGCDSSVDAQVKELLTLAQNSLDPPAGFAIPSAADLNKVREQANIQTVLADLKAGGDKGKLTWLAVCSGEFPEALAKAYEVNAATPDAIVITAALGTTEDEVNASTGPNAVLKIAGQPEAARLEKDSIFRFSGKVTVYTPDPFNLTWENVKVNAEDIPEEKGKKPAKKPGKAKP